MGLERIAQVHRALHLEPRFPLITVGGTNGKGSVCAFLESVLGAAGYKVGVYSSPHLLVANERIRIDGLQASDEEICAAFAQVEMGRGQVPITYFEYWTLAAMVLFIQQGVDVAVLEVGMGGRLDAVNLFDADVAVIASIDIDHQEFLGCDRESVATEKAGIFRPGRPAVCGDPAPPVTLSARAKEIGAPLLRAERDFGWAQRASGWDFWSPRQSWLALPPPGLNGAFQYGNASTALAALAAIGARLPVGRVAVERGLRTAFVPARFQIVDRAPEVILDVAHNPHGAKALAANLRARPCAGPTVAVFGMMGNKDTAGVIGAMDGVVSIWITCDLDSPRAASASSLQDALIGCGVGGSVRGYGRAADAFEAALALAGREGRVVVFGSFVTVAAVLQARSADRQDPARRVR